MGALAQATQTITLSEEPVSEEGALYEGTVRLDVNVRGNMGLVVSFMKTLRERPELRLLRLSNQPEGGVSITLGLREPVRLREIVSDMEGVSDAGEAANGASGDEAVLAVTLSG